MKLLLPGVAVAILLHFKAQAGSVLFDFDNAPLHSPLPVTLTAGGITAEFLATGQGYSIQQANTMGFTPPGFSGYCIYPSSVFAADLIINFSIPITDFSILYSPNELGCDDSATMRVSAYMGTTLIGTSITNCSQPGTWPSEYLRFQSIQPFTNVLVHYDHRPPTCQDYGVVFMADNMTVTPAPIPVTITNAQVLPSGAFHFSFANSPAGSFEVLSTSDPTQPLLSWTTLGAVTEISPGQYQFTDLEAATATKKFYRVRSL